MTDQERAEKEAQLADLERKLDKRIAEPGFADSVAMIQERIAAIKQELDGAA